MKIEQEPAYLLHSRPYRETSIIADLFTLNHGRQSGVLRGQRASQGGHKQAVMRPFQPLLIAWIGKSTLKTITHWERGATVVTLNGKSLYSGLYCNELLVKLLAPNDPHPALFHHYANLLEPLAAAEDIEKSLRNFELDLLDELGYGVNFECDARSSKPITEELWYELFDDEGFVQLQHKPDQKTNFYCGADLLRIGRRDFTNPQTRVSAKRLARHLLDHRLGGKPLAARDLFRKPG